MSQKKKFLTNLSTNLHGGPWGDPNANKEKNFFLKYDFYETVGNVIDWKCAGLEIEIPLPNNKTYC